MSVKLENCTDKIQVRIAEGSKAVHAVSSSRL